jgi:hypothetical protein
MNKIVFIYSQKARRERAKALSQSIIACNKRKHDLRQKIMSFIFAVMRHKSREAARENEIPSASCECVLSALLLCCRRRARERESLIV